MSTDKPMAAGPHARCPEVVALLTDFGLTDHYVGVMKGVILSVLPEARIVDICHGVPAQDLIGGARMLLECVDYFPPSTVFCVVVDPGVGSERRAIAARFGTRRFVAPDNGVLWPTLSALAARQPASEPSSAPSAPGLTVPELLGDRAPDGIALSTLSPSLAAVDIGAGNYGLKASSTTFHGRDLFAPASAHLASGVPLESLGPPLQTLVRLDLPQPRRTGPEVRGVVVHVDHFGNLITNLRAADLPNTDDEVEVRLDSRSMSVAIRSIESTYADVAPGTPLALVGSGGMLEISVRDGSAAERFDAIAGCEVVVQRLRTESLSRRLKRRKNQK